jgi:hypothetical protein
MRWLIKALVHKANRQVDLHWIGVNFDVFPWNLRQCFCQGGWEEAVL